MRILFTATPAYGHVLPLAPLADAAVAAGHEVGFMTSDGFRAETMAELPAAVRFLPAGVLPAEFTREAARRTGTDVFRPSPEVIGEVFGGVRLDLGMADARARLGEFAPDIVIAESFDMLGSFVAAEGGVPWHCAGIGPGMPAVVAAAIAEKAAERYRHIAALTYLDPCPAQLQDPDWRSDVPVLPMRVSAHRRPEPVPMSIEPFADPDRPTVLLTLGTIFSDPDLLSGAIGALADAKTNVIATLGASLRYGAAADGSPALDAEHVRVVPFVPLGQLIELADLVIGVGGSGTVLGSLAMGRPMVLWPQGADQPMTAARTESAGVAVVVDSLETMPDAVATVLADDTYTARARKMADQNAAKSTPADIIEAVVRRTP